MVLSMIGAKMTNTDERVGAYLLKHRATADAESIALNCDITEQDPVGYLSRVSSENWRSEVRTRDYNIGESDYGTRKIQPWDIWLEYDLNPWDADIIKRVLRTKAGQRVLDYEKIKHICDERIRQIDEEEQHAGMARETSPDTKDQKSGSRS